MFVYRYMYIVSKLECLYIILDWVRDSMKGALLPQDSKNIMFYMYLKTLQCTRSEEE